MAQRPEPIATHSAQEEPRQPSFDEKRVINAKLEEVYLDERRGYADDWSDQRVAKDLGVPRKWVEVQREANFGPVRESEAIRETVAEAIKVRDEARKAIDELRAEASRHAATANDLTTKAAMLEARLSATDKRVASLEKTVA